MLLLSANIPEISGQVQMPCQKVNASVIGVQPVKNFFVDGEGQASDANVLH